jgi:hypothetical protein
MPDFAPQKSWEPDKWTARHALVCDLHIAGKNNREIAEIMERHEAWVSQILSDRRSEIYIKEKMERRLDKLPGILEQLEELAPDAISVIREDLKLSKEEMDKGDRAVRSRSAFSVLASLGYGPVQRQLRIKAELPADLLRRSVDVLGQMKEIQAAYRYHEPPAEEDFEGDEEIGDGEANAA